MRRPLPTYVRTVRFAFGLALGLGVVLASSAHADRNDLTLERLIGPPSSPGAVNDVTSIPLQSAYRSLVSELGVVMAPRLLTPADTLGYSGFAFTFDSTHTSINDKADYWQKGVRNVSGNFLSTVSVTARKGLWAPFPSFEIGAGLTYLVDSSIYALNAYAKFGIQEGYHGWILPSIAVRGSVARLLGTNQIDMTVISTDLTISKSFGIAGSFKLDPYIGANLLINIVRSQVIDSTPNIDAYKQGGMGLDLNSNTVFPNQDSILRWRLFVGLRWVWSIVSITGEFAWAFCNDTATNCRGDGGTKIFDRSDGQATISVGAGLQF